MSAVRRLVALLTVLVLAGVASACVRDESALVTGRVDVEEGGELPPCPLDALDEATGPVEVVLWHALTGKSKEALDQLTASFNASQPKVKVVARSQGQAYDEVLNKYLASLGGGLPDIVYLEDTSLRLMVDTGALLPAEACAAVDGSEYPVKEAVRNYYSADGVFWPGYANVSEPVLYYNANHFRRAGLDPEDPPETLAEIEEMAEKLKAAGIEKPLALINNAWFTESWINGAGESVVNNANGRDGRATEATFDNPAAHELFAWLDRMQTKGLLEPVSATDGQINQYLAVATQKSSMTIETSTAATTIKAFLGGEEVDGQSAGGQVDLSKIQPRAAAFPGLEEPGRVRVSGGAFFLTASSPPAEIAASWQFMRYLQQVESQVTWHLLGSYLPATEEAAEDPQVQAFWQDDLAGQMLDVAAQQLTAIDPERPGPTIGPYPDYSNAIKNGLDRLLLSGASVEEAVAGVQRDIQAALDQYNEDNPIEAPEGG